MQSVTINVFMSNEKSVWDIIVEGRFQKSIAESMSGSV